VASAFREAPEVDVALALVAFASLLANAALNANGGELSVAAVLLAALASLPLVIRRRYPLGVLSAVAAGLLACLAVFHPNFAAVAVIGLALYTVGLQGRRLRSLIVGAAMAPVVAAAVLITSGAGFEPGATLARLALLLAALAAGDARRGRRELIAAAAAEAEREQDAAARHRFDEERLRLAHELHDTVAHTLVAINVRAAAAMHLQRSQPEEGVAALEEIKRSSAGALAELRSTLKLLRPVGAQAPLRPAQSLADLDELIDGVSGAGVHVQLRAGAIPDGLAAPIAHAAYRIIQESLTNVLRHSTARHAVVELSYAERLLTVEIRDDGDAPGSSSARVPAPPGHGLQGMAERAAALGGHCEAAAVPGGGWRVMASLPAGPETR